MIEIKAKDLEQGEEFSYGGREFIALGWEQNGILAIAKELIKNTPFDDGCSNYWKCSSLRKYLNGDFLKNEIDASALIPFTSDLTADDGSKDYDQSTDLVFLLSADLYRKYRYQMQRWRWNTWVWLITPWSCLPNAALVRYVYTDGTLRNSSPESHGIGVAAACSFNPEATVICTNYKSKVDVTNG